MKRRSGERINWTNYLSDLNDPEHWLGSERETFVQKVQAEHPELFREISRIVLWESRVPALNEQAFFNLTFPKGKSSCVSVLEAIFSENGQSKEALFTYHNDATYNSSTGTTAHGAVVPEKTTATQLVDILENPRSGEFSGFERRFVELPVDIPTTRWSVYFHFLKKEGFLGSKHDYWPTINRIFKHSGTPNITPTKFEKLGSKRLHGQDYIETLRNRLREENII